MTKKKTQLLQVRVTPDLAREAKQTARQEGESLATIVRRLLRGWLAERRPKESKPE